MAKSTVERPPSWSAHTVLKAAPSTRSTRIALATSPYRASRMVSRTAKHSGRPSAVSTKEASPSTVPWTTLPGRVERPMRIPDASSTRFPSENFARCSRSSARFSGAAALSDKLSAIMAVRLFTRNRR